MNRIRQFFSLLRLLLWSILFGDRTWARLRLLGLGAAILAFQILAVRDWDNDLFIEATTKIEHSHSIFEALPKVISLAIGLFANIQTIRYLLAPVGAVIFALLIAALYVQDIYELRHYRNALRYVIASMFGLFYPSLEIRNGELQVDADQENLLDKIGGPGWVIIRPGNVVLFERLTHPTAVLAEGRHFIPRFEMIKQIVNLKDQHGYIERISAVTKDGVVINIHDIHYNYRLWAGRRLGGEAGRTPKNPYPFSVRAVRNLAYNRAVTGDGVTPWARNVRSLFEGEIQNYIRRRQLDQVTSPKVAESDPRGEIHRLYETAEFRRRFQDIGAELVWYGIGHMEVDDTFVNEQRVQTWQAGWRGDAEVITAYSEALKEVYREQGRAEAQAEILLAIIQALRDANIQPGQENVQGLFLMRIAQLLEAMNDNSPLG